MKVAGWMSFRFTKIGPYALALLASLGLFMASGANAFAAFADEIEPAGDGSVDVDLFDALRHAFANATAEQDGSVPSQLAPASSEEDDLAYPSDDAATEVDAIDIENSDDSWSEPGGDDEFPCDPTGPPGCDDYHQVWLISSRAIGACDDAIAAVERICYWRYEHGCGWIASNSEEFQASDDPNVPTVFFVHGHRIDQGYAKSGGWDAYRAIVKPTAVPTRFVIFSWPTTPHGHPMREFRIRACESETHGYYLAWVIDRIQSEVPIHLVGFSYGSRLISSTLHYLGGGAIGRRSLDDRVFPDRLPLRASLIAAALDNDWLLPGRRHGQALTQVDRLFITRNAIDPVLHWYPVVLRNRARSHLE